MENLESVIRKVRRLKRSESIAVTKHPRGIYTIVSINQNDLPYVELEVVQASIDYGIILIPRGVRGFFPGYKRQFVLETDVKLFVMHVSSGNLATRVGDANSGIYIGHPRVTEIDEKFLDECPDAKDHREGSFKRFYEANDEIRVGSLLVVRRMNVEHYRLENSNNTLNIGG